jgi:regulator of protease activity HflC (stomatin/prohibitin superfamily)
MAAAQKTEINIPGPVIFGGILLVAVLAILIINPFYIVSAGERAIVLEFGKPQPDAIAEGIHVRIPIYQSIVKTDIRTQKYEADLSAASKDLQTVSTKIAINYRVNSGSVVELYKTVGTDFASKIIVPIEQEANKAVTAQYTAEELVTKREEVREKMKALLTERLTPRGIIVEEFSIVNFDFSASFNSAIEAKVTAEQEALAAKNKLEQVKFEAAATLAVKEAEAEGLRAQKEQITPDLLELRRIEVSKIMAEKWNGAYPTTYMTFGDSGATPLINIPTSG